ncbi:acyl carrier protein [Longimycelium tulufanense]|nr:acyl carrier protein [Longimycelium tulufanense]
MADQPSNPPTPHLTVSRAKQILAHRLNIDARHLDDEMTIEELGLDSMVLTEFVVALENVIGAQLDTQLLAERVTPSMPLQALLAVITDAVERAVEQTEVAS